MVGFLSFSVHGVSSRTEITVFLHVVRTTIFSLPKNSSIFRHWPLISAFEIVDVFFSLQRTLISLTDCEVCTFESSSLTSNSERNSLWKEAKHWKEILVILLKWDEKLKGVARASYSATKNKSFFKLAFCIAYYNASKAYIFVIRTIN